MKFNNCSTLAEIYLNSAADHVYTLLFYTLFTHYLTGNIYELKTVHLKPTPNKITSLIECQILNPTVAGGGWGVLSMKMDIFYRAVVL